MTSIFALGVEKNVLGRYLAWFVLWAAGMIGLALSGLAPKDDGKNPSKAPAGAVGEEDTGGQEP
jgi:hypothetical protein